MVAVAKGKFIRISPYKVRRIANEIKNKNVVDEILDPMADTTLEEARAYDKNAVLGGNVEIPLDTKDFRRIVAQTAKSVIRQGIREAEKEINNKEFAARNHEMVTARVVDINLETGDAKVEIEKAGGIC
mgnify:CR=1 FL=1